MGNLKNRDIQGNEIFSQSQSAANLTNQEGCTQMEVLYLSITVLVNMYVIYHFSRKQIKSTVAVVNPLLVCTIVNRLNQEHAVCASTSKGINNNSQKMNSVKVLQYIYRTVVVKSFMDRCICTIRTFLNIQTFVKFACLSCEVWKQLQNLCTFSCTFFFLKS